MNDARTRRMHAIKDRRPFRDASALRGESSGTYHTGRLDQRHADQYNEHRGRGCMDFVIYSYGTPIAWHLQDDPVMGTCWIFPSAKYSVTTSRHQSEVLGIIGYKDDDVVTLSGDVA